jgi:hypothetical protein
MAATLKDAILELTLVKSTESKTVKQHNDAVFNKHSAY